MEITFHLHHKGYRVVLEPNAQIFSDVPDTLNKLFRQRMRWSRGGFYTAYKYRKELFSKKKLFFQFFFPMKLILDLSAIFFLIMILRLGWETLAGVGGAWQTISSIAFERLPYIPVYLNSSLTFLFVMLAVTAILIFFGAQATGRKTTDLSPWGVLLFIFVYGSFIVSVYFYSLTKAILGAEQKW
jgi:cellulose synthase/poly-beta-1,6-N-acetylglucosamine synthase-like glycosyltransferase